VAPEEAPVATVQESGMEPRPGGEGFFEVVGRQPDVS
jgi:hypothetical protein